MNFPTAEPQLVIRRGSTLHGGDPADVLPEEAKGALADLRQRDEEAAALHRLAVDAQQEQFLAKLGHQARIKQLMMPQAEGGYSLEADAPQVLAEQARLAKVEAEIARRREVSEMRSAKRSNLRRLVERIEKWLTEGRPVGSVLVMSDAPPPSLKKNENVLDAIEARQRRLRELDAEAHRIDSAPYPSALSKQRVRSQVEAIAERSAPSVLGLVEAGEPIELFRTKNVVLSAPVEGSSAERPGFIVPTIPVPDMGLLIWLMKDTLLSKLESEIDACSNDAEALTDPQRAQKLAVVMSDRLAVEREECVLIEIGCAQGLNAAYRHDTSPEAVLQVKFVEAPTSTPIGTSAGHLIERRGAQRVG